MRYRSTLINLFQMLFLSKLSFLINPKLGLFATSSLLIISLLNSLFQKATKNLVCLTSIVFLALYTEYALPIRDPFSRMIVIYSVILIGIISYAKICQLNLKKLVFSKNKSLRQLLILFGFGLIWGGSLYLIAGPNAINIKTDLNWLLILSPLIALIEELLIRGLIQAQAEKLTNPLMGLIYASLIWFSFNLSGNILLSVIYGLTGFGLSYIYKLTRDLRSSYAVNLGMKFGLLMLIRFF